MTETMRLIGSKGETEARAGDRFNWWDGSSWEVVGPADGWNYSPSGIGGCPSVRLRLVAGEMDAISRKYIEDDGCVVWCGDSVATGLINTKAFAQ